MRPKIPGSWIPRTVLSRRTTWKRNTTANSQRKSEKDSGFWSKRSRGRPVVIHQAGGHQSAKCSPKRREESGGAVRTCSRCPFRVGTAYMLVTLSPTRPFDAVCSLMSNRMAAKRAYYRRLDRTNDMGQVSKPNFCCHQFQRFMKPGCLLSQSCIESNVRHIIGLLSLTTRCSGGFQTQRRAQSSSIKIGYLREPSAAGASGRCRPWRVTACPDVKRAVVSTARLHSRSDRRSPSSKHRRWPIDEPGPSRTEGCIFNIISVFVVELRAPH